MNRKLERKLIKKFPLCFADHNRSMKESLMCFGCSCNDGWYKIIYEACEKAEPLIKKYIEENPYKPQFPSWVFSRYNLPIVLQWRCYSFIALWQWLLEILNLRTPDPWWPRLVQIKEKYAMLRMYWTNYIDGITEIEREAEEKSSVTCEQCGKEGKIRGEKSGWLYTSCFQHSKSQDRDNIEYLEWKYKQQNRRKKNV